MIIFKRTANSIRHFLSIFKIKPNRDFGPNFTISDKRKVVSKIKLNKSVRWKSTTTVELIPLFLESKKPGTLKFAHSFLPKIFGWNGYDSKYFKIRSNRIKSKWGLGNLINNYKILELQNIQIKNNYYKPNSLNLYTFKTIKPIEKPDTEIHKGFNLMVSGSDSFQHFLLDLLPLLAVVRNFLNHHPDLPILMLKPNHNFKNRKYFFRLLGISNPIFDIEIGKIETLKIRKMYLIDFKPKRMLYLNHSAALSLIPRYYKNLSFKTVVKEPNQITFIKRTARNRILIDESFLINYLKKLAIDLDLELQVIEPENLSRASIFATMQKTKICFVIHGGSALNIVGMNPGSKVIEFMPIHESDTIGYFATGLMLHYIPIPLSLAKNDKFWSISTDVIYALPKLLQN